MQWLVLVPIINIGIFILACVISACVKGSSRKGGDITPRLTPDDAPTPVETYTMQHENPELADQFDGRLTNVFKNPMKGIL